MSMCTERKPLPFTVTAEDVARHQLDPEDEGRPALVIQGAIQLFDTEASRAECLRVLSAPEG